MVRPEKNESEITALGTQFGLVTPYTSLIVLESTTQYAEFGIPPPNATEVERKRYDELARQIRDQRDNDQARHFDEVVRLWNDHVATVDRTQPTKGRVSPSSHARNNPSGPRKRSYSASHSWGQSLPSNGLSASGGMGGMMGGMGMGMGGMAGGGMGGGAFGRVPLAVEWAAWEWVAWEWAAWEWAAAEA